MDRVRDLVIGWYARLDRERKILFVLLGLVFVRGLIYAVVVPAWQSADEPQYFLGLQRFALETVPSLARPLIGEPVGNLRFFELVYLPVYLVGSATSLATQLLLLRLATVLAGVATIYVIHLVAKEMAPESRLVSFGAPLLVSMIPQFSHEAGSFSPDILTTLGASVFFLFALLLIKKGFSLRRTLGLLAGLTVAVLTKQTGFFVLPLAALLPVAVLYRRAWEESRAGVRRTAVGVYLACLAAFVPVVSWVASRTTQMNLDLDLIRQLVSPPFLVGIFSPLAESGNVFFTSFWAHAGWLSMRMESTYYAVLVTLGIIALAGLVLWLFEAASEWDKARWKLLVVAFFGLALLLEVTIVLARTALTPGVGMAQGRWAYPALAPFAVLALLGLHALAKYRRERLFLTLIACNLFVLDAVYVLGYLARDYYTRFPIAIDQGTMVWAREISAEVGQATVSSRPWALRQPLLYLILFAGYLLLFAYWLYTLARDREVEVAPRGGMHEGWRLPSLKQDEVFVAEESGSANQG